MLVVEAASGFSFRFQFLIMMRAQDLFCSPIQTALGAGEDRIGPTPAPARFHCSAISRGRDWPQEFLNHRWLESGSCTS